jgi:glycosyltransferase involved in cell wall biosynthesis
VSATAAHLAMLHEVRRRAGEFDVIHVHLSHFIHFPVLDGLEACTVTTPHGRLDYVDLPGALACWPDFPFISISMRQREPLPQARWIGNVYHGLPLAAYPRARPREDRYLAFLGRVSRDKRLDRAIEIARRAGMKLKIAAKRDEADDEYFQGVIQPMLGDDTEFVGEIDEAGKAGFFAGAAALLFPIDWPEPFGLVAIEAMAFGVPVIAWPNGALPEVVDEGRTGFLVDSIDGAVAAVGRCRGLDPAAIREAFEERFSAGRMVSDYEAIYARLVRPLARRA